ncbi:MAG: HEAT repeat domain-containing protein [Gammaproteobacteria bacterium]|nr:HEAT repeat domain-containing protein [Gammaproteobacteria bacterium]
MLATENDQATNSQPPACKAGVITSLRNLLDTGDEVDKCNASRALGSIGACEAIDDLVLRLRDEDIDVSIDAAEALGKLKAKRVVPQLIDSLKNDPDGELKTVIVKALGEIADPASIPVLLELAEHQPEDMIYDSNDDWNDWWDMQKQAVVALGNMHVEQAGDVLKRLLLDEDALDIEHDILKALVKIGASGEKVVVEQLNSGSVLSRRRAAYALSFSQTPESLKSLASLFRDRAEDVRLSALQAIVDRKATKYLAAVNLLKKDRSEKVRQAAILAYNELAVLSESTTTLAPNHSRLLNDPDGNVRATYLVSLQCEDLQIDENELSKLVYSALKDSDEHVVEAAIPLLLRLPDKKAGIDRLIDMLESSTSSTQVMQACLQTLVKFSRWNSDIAQVMYGLIGHKDSAVRLATLRALMQMECEIDSLKIPAQNNTPIDMVEAALKGYVVPHIEIAPTVEDDNADSSAQAQANDEETDDVAATSTLESIMQDNRQVEYLLQEANSAPVVDVDQDPSLDEYHDLVEGNIVRGEWLFGQKQAVPIAQDVQRLAARLLSNIPAHLGDQKTTRIINSLLSALNSGDEVLRCSVADSITQIAKDNPDTAGLEYSYGGLVTQFHNQQWDLKLSCMRALAAIRNRGAIPVVLTALEHERSALRVEALHAITDLQLYGNEPVKNAHLPEDSPSLIEWVNTLIGYLTDAEPGIRYSSVANLKRCLAAEEVRQQAGLCETAIEKIVAAAFENLGGRTRDMAQVLKEFAPEQGTSILLKYLNELQSSYDRRFAIEMLEEMYRSATLNLN